MLQDVSESAQEQAPTVIAICRQASTTRAQGQHYCSTAITTLQHLESALTPLLLCPKQKKKILVGNATPVVSEHVYV
jgi:hypothetical protein